MIVAMVRQPDGWELIEAAMECVQETIAEDPRRKKHLRLIG